MGIKFSKNLIDAMKNNRLDTDNISTNNGSRLKISSNMKEIVPDNDIEIQIANVVNSDELIEKLYERNTFSYNEDRDKLVIEKWLDKRKNGRASLYDTFNSVNYSLNKINEAGLLFEGGKQISGSPREFTSDELRTRGRYDYRITLTNSDKITTEELISFLQTFIDEAKRRNINLRAKSGVGKDLFILYCYEDKLYDTVLLLEELKNSSKYGELVSGATKKFGDIKEFSATLNKDSYYGISMATSETGMDRYLEIMNSNQKTLKGYYGGAFGDTFGDYIGKLLEQSYQSLLMTSPDKINVSNMYNEMKRRHKKFMLGDSESLLEIPFWMNRRNYEKILRMEEAKKSGYIVNDDFELFDSKGRGR